MGGVTRWPGVLPTHLGAGKLCLCHVLADTEVTIVFFRQNDPTMPLAQFPDRKY